MTTFIPGTPNPMRRRAAMQSALFNARKNRVARLTQQQNDDITFSASPPNPDAESGTQGDGENH